MTSAPFQNTPEWISRLPLQSFSHYFSVPTAGSIDIMVGSQYYICCCQGSLNMCITIADYQTLHQFLVFVLHSLICYCSVVDLKPLYDYC